MISILIQEVNQGRHIDLAITSNGRQQAVLIPHTASKAIILLKLQKLINNIEHDELFK